MTSTMRFDRWENTATTKSVTMDQIAGGTGLVPIVPTGATFAGGTGTVGALGNVTFSNITTLGLDGVFTSKYKNYRIVFGKVTGSEIYFAFRKNGVRIDNGYLMTGITGNNSGTASYYVQQYVSICLVGSSNSNNLTLEISSPLDSGDPGFQVQSGGYSSTDRAWFINGSGIKAGGGGPFDGITFTTSSSISGSVSVYGYNQ